MKNKTSTRYKKDRRTYYRSSMGRVDAHPLRNLDSVATTEGGPIVDERGWASLSRPRARVVVIASAERRWWIFVFDLHVVVFMIRAGAVNFDV